MAPRRITAIALGMSIIAAGCSGKKDGESSDSPVPKPSPSQPEQVVTPTPTPTPDTTPTKLCIDPSDLQIESLDLEGLQDEMPAIELSEPLSKVLDGLVAHGTPIPLDSGDIAVPALRCNDASCRAGILLLDPSGTERSLSPLLDDVDRTTEMTFVAALADANSDGTSDLWISYQRRDKDGASELHVAALTLPDMSVQWHGMVGNSPASDDKPGCDGAIYPADADCDGDGDVLVVQRCGPMRCLADEGEVAQGCADNAVTEKIAVYRWDPSSKRYQANQP